MSWAVIRIATVESGQMRRLNLWRNTEKTPVARHECARSSLQVAIACVGDAVLSLIVADYLYERFPSENEGFFTRMRSKIVNGVMLADLSAMLGLGRFLLVSRQVEENGGRKAKNILEDCFEAFLGAIYLSTTFEKAKTWFVSFLEESVDVTELVMTQNNNKDILAKYFQHAFNCQPVYEFANSNSKFVVLVKNGSHIVSKGTGATRKLAEEDASKAALKYFNL